WSTWSSTSHKLKASWRTIPVEGRTVLVREDLNVPLHDGAVADDTRLRAAAPTLRALAGAGARVVVTSHLGRPKGRDAGLSLKVVVDPLSDLIGRKVRFVSDCVGPEVEAARSNL